MVSGATNELPLDNVKSAKTPLATSSRPRNTVTHPPFPWPNLYSPGYHSFYISMPHGPRTSSS
jgi:hypothetical protein